MSKSNQLPKKHGGRIKPNSILIWPRSYFLLRTSPPIPLPPLHRTLNLDRANKALGEEGPDGAHDGEDGGGGDEEVGEEAFAGGDLGLEEAEVECQGQAFLSPRTTK